MFDIDYLDIAPLHTAAGTVILPGSKSISNRVLLLAALSEGRTRICNLLASDDTAVMLTALRQLGCKIDEMPHCIDITGGGGGAMLREARLFLGNAGTAMRPLTAALALLGGNYVLSGVPRMHERPIGDLVDALRGLGCSIGYLENTGFPPLQIKAPKLNLDQPIRVRGDVSSQFLTSLLMALPLVATHDIVIEVIGELISKPYIKITLELLARFGVTVRHANWQTFTIAAGSRFQSPGELHVEGDASSASYFVALGAIASDRSRPIEIKGIGTDSIQGDIRFIDAARQMGAHIESNENALRVSRGDWPLQAIDLDCNHMPDAAMTLAAMALYAKGTTVLRNIASWRVKETDRIAAMACELQKMGAEVEAGPDYLKITAPRIWTTAPIATYDDHRMAMCLSLAAFNPARLPVRILDPKCVAKTFPDYFETLFAVSQARPADIPVICVDGPTASGKGTLAAQLARRLGYHYLDSGALYRLTALAATQAGVDLDDAPAVGAIARTLPVRFEHGHIWLQGQDVSELIRTEAFGMAASKVSAHGEVRAALVTLQHSFRQLPGLVADGRDMGTVIFPDAKLKIFLTASALHRAERRHKQLISKGNNAILGIIRQDLEARDRGDQSRQFAPLKPADDARPMDNSDLSIEESIDLVLNWWQVGRPFRPQ